MIFKKIRQNTTNYELRATNYEIGIDFLKYCNILCFV